MTTKSEKLQYIMKLIDLKLGSYEMKEAFARAADSDYQVQLYNQLVDDIVFITVGAPGLRYWQTSADNGFPTVWASTRDELIHHPFHKITEIDQEEFQKLRRSEWAQLSTTDRDVKSPKEFEALYGQNPTPTEETTNGNKT